MSLAPVRVRSVSKVPADPVGFWLGRLGNDHTRRGHLSYFNIFLGWLRRQPGWEFVSPRDLLVRQIQGEDSYEVLDLVQSFVGGMRGRKASKAKAYTVIRSFFLHNRCVLPADPAFRLHGDEAPVVPRLSVENIVEVCHAANLCYRSAILVKWQGFLDTLRLVYVGKRLSEQVVTQIQQDMDPVRLDLPGRKSNSNDREGTYYTFIAKDAVDALVKYFEEERGWPKPGQPIWLIKEGRPLSKSAFENTWLRLFRRLGRIPKKPGYSPRSRYGYNPHEMRDIAISLCHTQAKKYGFDMDCARFWAGQVGQIDPLKYDKFYQDTQYMKDQYVIAANCLNIISQKPTATAEEQKKIQALEEKVRSQGEQMAKMENALAAIRGEVVQAGRRLDS